MKKLNINSIFINSSTDNGELQYLNQMINNEHNYPKIIYTTPETLQFNIIFNKIIENMYEKGLIERLVIDEVHCLSQWGHDFRKTYLYISDFLINFPIPCIGLTASLTPVTKNDVI